MTIAWRTGCWVLVAVVRLAGLAGTLRVPEDYPTIQAALAAASSRDVIEIARGVYTEDLVIAQSVTLRGELVPVALAPGEVPFPWELDTGVRIVGTGGQSEAVVVRGNVSVTLESLTILGGRAAALAAEGQTRVVIRNTAIMGSRGVGLWVRESARVLLDACLVARNASYGVLGLDSAEVHLRNCLLVGNGESALLTAGAAQADVTGCLVYHNLRGLEVDGTGRLTVRDSVIHGNATAGVRVSGWAGTSRVELRGCTVASNGLAGIFALGQAEVKLAHNLIADNRGSGIVLVERVTLEAVGNRVVRNSGYGLLLYLDPCHEPTGLRLPPVLVFRGKVAGTENWVPGPGEPDENGFGALCPGVPIFPWPAGFAGTQIWERKDP